MAGQYSVEQMEKVLDVVAEGLNVGSKVLHKGGVLSALALVDELQALSSLDADLLAKEAGELDAADLARLDARFSGKLDLVNKAVEAKLKAAPGLALKGFDLFKRGQAYVSEIKAWVA